MSTLRYGYFGEDDALRLFLHHYLAAATAGLSWRFQYDQQFAYRYRAVNKQQVDEEFDEVCEVGLRDYQQQCFFVGRDLDNHDPSALRAMQLDMHQRLQVRNAQAVLLIPVQCIEHWLWYLKWHRENPHSTKNINLETQPRGEAKLAVYNAKKCSTRHSNPIVENLTADMDIGWLASRSTSFLAFHTQVQHYLAALPAA